MPVLHCPIATTTAGLANIHVEPFFTDSLVSAVFEHLVHDFLDFVLQRGVFFANSDSFPLGIEQFAYDFEWEVFRIDGVSRQQLVSDDGVHALVCHVIQRIGTGRVRRRICPELKRFFLVSGAETDADVYAFQVGTAVDVGIVWYDNGRAGSVVMDEVDLGHPLFRDRHAGQNDIVLIRKQTGNDAFPFGRYEFSFDAEPTRNFFCDVHIKPGPIVAVDKSGALRRDVEYDNPMWNWVAARTNPELLKGGISDVIDGADVFIGVSRPNLLKVEDIVRMNAEPIVFAMANPDPEIDPELAESHVRILATGRSDYPNQINNVLCFPGIFRGALDCRATTINEAMKLAAAEAIASVVTTEELNDHYIIPSIFNDKVVPAIRQAVIRAAIESNVARRIPPEFRSAHLQ